MTKTAKLALEKMESENLILEDRGSAAITLRTSNNEFVQYVSRIALNKMYPYLAMVSKNEFHVAFKIK